MIQTQKAISQLQKEIRKLKEGIVSIEELIVEKEREADRLMMILDEQQLKLLADNEKI